MCPRIQDYRMKPSCPRSGREPAEQPADAHGGETSASTYTVRIRRSSLVYGERDSKDTRQRRLGLPKQLPSFVYSDLFRLGPLVDHFRFRPHWFVPKHALNFQSPGPTYYSLRARGRDSNSKYAVSSEFIHSFPAPGKQQPPALAIC